MCIATTYADRIPSTLPTMSGSTEFRDFKLWLQSACQGDSPIPSGQLTKEAKSLWGHLADKDKQELVNAMQSVWDARRQLATANDGTRMTAEKAVGVSPPVARIALRELKQQLAARATALDVLSNRLATVDFSQRPTAGNEALSQRLARYQQESSTSLKQSSDVNSKWLALCAAFSGSLRAADELSSLFDLRKEISEDLLQSNPGYVPEEGDSVSSSRSASASKPASANKSTSASKRTRAQDDSVEASPAPGASPKKPRTQESITKEADAIFEQVDGLIEANALRERPLTSANNRDSPQDGPGASKQASGSARVGMAPLPQPQSSAHQPRSQIDRAANRDQTRFRPFPRPAKGKPGKYAKQLFESEEGLPDAFRDFCLRQLEKIHIAGPYDTMEDLEPVAKTLKVRN